MFLLSGCRTIDIKVFSKISTTVLYLILEETDQNEKTKMLNL